METTIQPIFVSFFFMLLVVQSFATDGKLYERGRSPIAIGSGLLGFRRSSISCQAEKQPERKDTLRKPLLPHLTGS